MRLSVVVPTWNGWSLLERNLPALREALEGMEDEAEVLVVDDGGNDGTAARLPELFPWARLIRRESNGGFSAACNTGIAQATGEWVLLLNNDMHPRPDALLRLMRMVEDVASDVFSIRPRIERFVTCSDEEYAHMAMRLEFRHGMLRMPLAILREETAGRPAFPVTSGGAGLFRRSMLGELGGFDEIYSPFYWEDVDLCYRALARGYVNLYAPDAVFRHAERGTIATTFRRGHVNRVAWRNACWFVWINIHDRGMLWRHWAWLPVHALRGLWRGEWWRLRGTVDALAGWRKAVRVRRVRRAERRVPDGDILAASHWGEERRRLS